MNILTRRSARLCPKLSQLPSVWHALVIAVTLMASPPASADEPIWRQQRFDLQATNEPLNVFLARMFTVENLPSVFSDAVATGRVNGRFRGRADVVFKEMADTYGLTWYFDGTTLYVYSLSEMQTRMLQVEPGDVGRVETALRQMKLYDNRFPLRISQSEGQVLVSAPPRYVELVGEVIERIADKPTLARHSVDIRVFRLKHARAADTMVNIGGVETTIAGVARTINELLATPPRDAPAPTPGPNARTLPATMPSLRGQGLAAVGNAKSKNPPGGLDAATIAAIESTANVNTANAPSDANAPSSGNPGIPAHFAPSPRATQHAAQNNAAALRPGTVRADPRLNAVVVRDQRERMQGYAQLIEALDIEVPLVQIEATVIDVSEDKSEELGLDWRLHTSRLDLASSPSGLSVPPGGSNGNVGTGTNIAQNLLAAGNPLSIGTGLVGTVLFGTQRQYFLSRVNALAEKGDASVVTRPQVLTTANAEAVIQSTNEFYVKVPGQYQTDLFNVSVGLVLRVTPMMVEDAQGRRWAMQIRIEDGSRASGSVGDVPVVNRSSIATRAVVGDGQSLLIGGYTTEQKSKSRTGVPTLSDMPLIGLLFGRRADTTHRSQRMFMITPKLVELSADTLPAAGSPGSPPPQALPPLSSLMMPTEFARATARSRGVPEP